MKTTKLFCLITCVLLIVSASRAGTFDCSVVYDEFDSLMNRNYLVEPDRYVGVKPDALSRSGFENLQKGQFHLYPERSGLGVALVHTNRNLRAKLLIDWNAMNPAGDSAVVGIPHGVIFGRVEDGYGPRKLAPVTLHAGFTLDLDRDAVQPVAGPGDESSADQRGADLEFVDVEGELRLRAINGATILFPVESLCSSVSK